MEAGERALPIAVLIWVKQALSKSCTISHERSALAAGFTLREGAGGFDDMFEAVDACGNAFDEMPARFGEPASEPL